MSRTMIEIQPGTESWDAWLAHHRGTKTELVMLRCRSRGEVFRAWDALPPEAPRRDRINNGGLFYAEAPASEKTERAGNHGDVEQVAARLEAKAARAAIETTATLERHEKNAREAGAFGVAIDAVRSGQTPNVADLPDVGVHYIDDPFEVRRGRKPKPLRPKLVNLRDDPIGQMAKRGQINPEQLGAARKWQALFDIAASIGASRGIDPGAMKVDGGRFSEPVSDAQFGSIKQLEKLDRILGGVGSNLVRCVLGERMSVTQVALIVGKAAHSARQHQNERERLGVRLRECLDTLIVAMGIEAKGRNHRSPRDEISELARYADNPLLYRAVHEALNKIV